MVLAEMAIGFEKLTCCQPEELSLVKVALANKLPDPDVDQRCATCVPVFLGAL
jgi:hypothetical protein